MVLAHLLGLRHVMATPRRHSPLPTPGHVPGPRHTASGIASGVIDVSGADDTMTFRALHEDLLREFAAITDVAVNGDRDAAAEIARRHVPRLVAGLRAVLAEHVPDEQGQCAVCVSGRWWRRGPRLCRLLTEFRLAMVTYDQKPLSRARHRLCPRRS